MEKEKHITDMKLIADFIGLTWNVNEFESFFEHTFMASYANLQYWDDMDSDFNIDPYKYLRFSTSWDWIMPVIEKIETLSFEVIFYKLGCMIKFPNKEHLPIATNADTKMKAVYDCILLFIKWHNSLEQTHHFIALVPMGGKYTGKMGQHSTHQKCIEDAAIWATERFKTQAIVVLAEGLNSFDNDTALTKYLEGLKK